VVAVVDVVPFPVVEVVDGLVVVEVATLAGVVLVVVGAVGRTAASAVGGGVQFAPVSAATAWAALYCVLPTSSGATSLRVSANCIRLENTGAAAAPPYVDVGSSSTTIAERRGCCAGAKPMNDAIVPSE